MVVSSCKIYIGCRVSNGRDTTPNQESHDVFQSSNNNILNQGFKDQVLSGHHDKWICGLSQLPRAFLHSASRARAIVDPME